MAFSRRRVYFNVFPDSVANTTLVLFCLHWLSLSPYLSQTLFTLLLLPFALSFAHKDFFVLDRYIHNQTQNPNIKNQRRVFSFVLKREREREREMALSLNSMMSFPSYKLSSKPLNLRSPRVLMASTLHSTSK